MLASRPAFSWWAIDGHQRDDGTHTQIDAAQRDDQRHSYRAQRDDDRLAHHQLQRQAAEERIRQHRREHAIDEDQRA
jgi:hypothetical protein